MSRFLEVKYQLHSYLVHIVPKDVLRLVMEYHASDSDKLFILLSDPFLPPVISFGNLLNRFNKQSRIISLY
jgi:hypothetical protein